MSKRRWSDPGWIFPRLAVLIAVIMIATMSLWLLALRFADD